MEIHQSREKQTLLLESPTRYGDSIQNVVHALEGLFFIFFGSFQRLSKFKKCIQS